MLNFRPVELDLRFKAVPEDSGHIELVGDAIRYTSSTYSDWTIRVDEVRVFGEATDPNGPFADDYFLCFATGPGMWREASFYASGRDAFLDALGVRFQVRLQLGLVGSTDFASRILWPLGLAGKPMFKYQVVPPETVVGRLIGSTQIRMAYSDQVLATLGTDG